MLSNQLRDSFQRYFQDKGHHIVGSASLVVKDDPTLMFTNAGMNQFKDVFLGFSTSDYKRVVNSQKCLRVSGKHNDLEEVGHDTYHHTMFEMLGNWSFGDYFKKEAIDWAWEYLTDVLHINKEKLYATVFEGSQDERIDMDMDAFKQWQTHLPDDRILTGNKKDNFWEMGSTGPCGPCSEIHIDLRNDKEVKKISGMDLVNTGHPEVIEIWNLVFIQYNRKTSGELEILPRQHVDTGMGFERLCCIVQNKKSNYDTDLFQPIIKKLSEISNTQYGSKDETDIAMRVIADHLRAVSFSIADGQLPSNNKAGYVIRRILRRAIRYGYSFLNQKEPFIHKLVSILAEIMGSFYPELISRKTLIEKVIKEEELAFLRTLETGIRLLDLHIQAANSTGLKKLSGKDAFTLYDTYGFPLDLTQLILRENNLSVNHSEFEQEMEEQKIRSKSDAHKDTGDWQIIREDKQDGEFTGYDKLEDNIKINRYRKIRQKGKDIWQLVFDKTPFFAESGGQVGDTGYIENETEKISISDTVKENNLFIHIAGKLPDDPMSSFHAVVNNGVRIDTANNHTSTHLLHFALREVLGPHVEQKGSLVHPDYLRFDFSHFQKVHDNELREIEKIVNNIIRQNIPVEDLRTVPIKKAREMGAIALFGEKYKDLVRVIRFGDSVELCGGTHVSATGQIGFFMILKESAISAGIRRIEAISGRKCAEHIYALDEKLKGIERTISSKQDPLNAIENLIRDNVELTRQLEKFKKEKLQKIKEELKHSAKIISGTHSIIFKADGLQPDDVKNLAFQLKGDFESLYFVAGYELNGKANLAVMISDDLVKNRKLNAIEIIKELSVEIQGGGGGQNFYATAGGKNPDGINSALKKAEILIRKLSG